MNIDQDIEQSTQSKRRTKPASPSHYICDRLWFLKYLEVSTVAIAVFLVRYFRSENTGHSKLCIYFDEIWKMNNILLMSGSTCYIYSSPLSNVEFSNFDYWLHVHLQYTNLRGEGLFLANATNRFQRGTRCIPQTGRSSPAYSHHELLVVTESCMDVATPVNISIFTWFSNCHPNTELAG